MKFKLSSGGLTAALPSFPEKEGRRQFPKPLTCSGFPKSCVCLQGKLNSLKSRHDQAEKATNLVAKAGSAYLLR